MCHTLVQGTFGRGFALLQFRKLVVRSPEGKRLRYVEFQAGSFALHRGVYCRNRGRLHGIFRESDSFFARHWPAGPDHHDAADTANVGNRNLQ
jgi:hypothetical protein